MRGGALGITQANCHLYFTIIRARIRRRLTAVAILAKGCGHGAVGGGVGHVLQIVAAVAVPVVASLNAVLF
jgi:hypothetical protein